MGDKTGIEWTDATWNPLIGCSKVGPGCDNCYAIGAVHRGAVMGTAQHVGLTVRAENGDKDWTGDVRAVPHRFDQPTRWSRPRKVFVNSLSDLFHPEAIHRRVAYQDGTWGLVAVIVAEMVANPRHTFQVLTKRPRLMSLVLANPMFRAEVDAILQARGLEVMPGGLDESDRLSWPRHIWWGTSIELDQFSWRADHLRDINGVRWISAEPLLGPLPSLDLTGIDWVVAGGESGPGARPMHPDWARDLRDRCATADVPFLFKQWGAWGPSWTISEVRPGMTSFVDLEGGIHGTEETNRPPSGWCGMNRAGKSRTGRTLDGCLHDGYPA